MPLRNNSNLETHKVAQARPTKAETKEAVLQPSGNRDGKGAYGHSMPGLNQVVCDPQEENLEARQCLPIAFLAFATKKQMDPEYWHQHAVDHRYLQELRTVPT